jgi:heme A synthase
MSVTLYALALLLGVAALVNAMWMGRHPRADSQNEVSIRTVLVSLAIVAGTGTQLAFTERPAAQIAGSIISILLIGAALLFRSRRSRTGH